MAGFRPVDPKQSFPALEETMLERWREREVFARSLARRESAPLWGFYEGPPTANGRPGSHHVLARVFKDIYPRFRTMTGHRVPRKAGWDCHGLPVELEVEGELGITSKEEIEAFGIAEFNERCRESVFRYVEDWNRLTERIGFWIDLDDPYVTMTNEYIESVWWALRRMWDDGRLYEDYKVVPYCPRDGTALSSHEVALGYHDVEDPAVYVKLPVRDADDGPLAEPEAAAVEGSGEEMMLARSGRLHEPVDLDRGIGIRFRRVAQRAAREEPRRQRPELRAVLFDERPRRPEPAAGVDRAPDHERVEPAHV